MKLSIRNKLVLIFIPLIIVPMTITTLVSMQITSKRLENELRDDSMNALKEAEALLVQYLEGARHFAQFVANSNDIKRSVQTGKAQESLEAINDLLQLKIVEVFSPEQRLLARGYVRQRDMKPYFTPSKDPIVARTLDLEIVSDYFPYPQGLAGRVSAPIIDVETLDALGAVIVSYPFNITLIQTVKAQIKAEVTIQWNPAGSIVSTIQDNEGQNIREIWNSAVSNFDAFGNSPLHKLEWIGPHLYAVTYTPLYNNEKQPVAILSTALNCDRLEQSKANTLKVIIISSGIAFVLALLMGVFIARSFTRPIYQLLASTRSMAEGRLEEEVDVSREDELGSLAKSFADMRNAIRNQINDLHAERDYSTSIIMGTPSIVCGITPGGTTIFINPAAEKITGYGAEEIIGKNWWPIFYPDDEYRQVTKLFSNFEKGKIRDYEMVLTNRVGEKYTILWNFINRFDDSGRLVEIIGFGNDVTKRKKAEDELKKHHDRLKELVDERTGELMKTNQDLQREIADRKQAEEELRRLRNLLSNIIDSMPSVLVGVDKDGRVTQWNREAEKMTGVSSDVAQGQIIEGVLPQFRLKMEKVRQAIRNRETQTETKVASTVDGETRLSDVTIYPLITKGVEGAVIRIDDVTERVRIEEMIIQSEKMLSVGGLAAGMAHEINNPLAGILQNTQVMSNRMKGDHLKNRRAAEECGTTVEVIRTYMDKRGIFPMIENILEAAQRAAKIVDNMLSFSRKSESRIQKVNMGELIDKSVELAENDYDLRKKYDFKQIEIKREYEPGMPKVPCDRAKIQQVILNLLKNSAQAMSDHDKRSDLPQIILRVRQDSKMACIEVEDNGPGLDESSRKRVFEPFYTTKEVGIGTGLGLSLSYYIITENHGGTMTVESIPGNGAKFIIKLPLERSEAHLSNPTPT
jgi:PAS domain S-box-containing protein